MKNIIDIQELQSQFVSNLEFIAKQVVEGFITGLHKSPYHGFSVEFAEHRIYNPGESTRYIDWKIYGRTEKLFIKKFEEETNLRSYIVLDTSSSMLFPFSRTSKSKSIEKNKFTFATYCTAALIYLLRKQRDAVGLTLFSDNIELQTESRLSSLHSKRLYAELVSRLSKETQQLNKKTRASDILHELAEKIKKRSLIIIFSDMIESESPEDILSALQHLRYNKHEIILFHVIDKKYEEDFEFQNRPYKFVDLESGNQIKLNPNEIRDFYKKQTGDYFYRLKIKCAQYRVDLIECDINADFSNILMSYLIKRKRLH